MPGENGQGIARLVPLLVQWRQGAFELRQRCVLGKHVGLRDRAQVQLMTQHGERFA